MNAPSVLNGWHRSRRAIIANGILNAKSQPLANPNGKPLAGLTGIPYASDGSGGSPCGGTVCDPDQGGCASSYAFRISCPGFPSIDGMTGTVNYGIGSVGQNWANNGSFSTPLLIAGCSCGESPGPNVGQFNIYFAATVSLFGYAWGGIFSIVCLPGTYSLPQYGEAGFYSCPGLGLGGGPSTPLSVTFS